MSDFCCETPDSGEPPCAGVVALRRELAETRDQLAGYVREDAIKASANKMLEERAERAEAENAALRERITEAIDAFDDRDDTGARAILKHAITTRKP